MKSPRSVRPSENPEGEEMESEEVEKSRVRETESVPSAKEVEEHNVDHAVFRRWCPHCVKGRAETHGHRTVKKSEVEVPKVSV